MIYAFDDYKLDIERYELRRAGDLLRVEPKVFDLLAYLIQHHGQFVSKEDLYAYLWPNQFVSESSLTYCVTVARKAVGDDGRVQRIIKTVYGRGYRFIALVQERLRGSADKEVTDDRPCSPGLRAREAERRQLTVLWCRVGASPILSEHLDPEELHEVLQDVYNMYAEVLRRFEGHTAQHFADGLTVYFGYPRAHEDDAHRAVRSALEMVRALGGLPIGRDREPGVKLTVRLGIHTGLVVVGEVGSEEKRQQLALGHTPHIAAQLAGLAEPCTVVISPATLKLVEGYFVCQALGSHILEELSQPLAVYRVLQESGVESRFAAAVTIGLTPFVGRREEVGLLRERWGQVKRGLGQVVLLSGEAGIGKSRLVQVLQERTAEDRYATIEYRCSPYHQNSALYPVVTDVQRWLQWHQDDAPQVKLRKLEAALEPYDFVLEEAVPLFASLLLLPLSDAYPPLNLAPQRQKQKTLDALLTLLLKQAEAQPVCFIIEDFHWADPSTLELLGLLMDQVQTSRMLLLLAFRPDFRPPWPMRSHVTHIALSRLTSRQVERMITRITRGKALPTEVVQQLVVKSDGVPLFVEEMTRMVLETGLVKERDGQYALVGPLTPLAIPSTLHDSLMARIDRLGTGKQVAQLGATLGREFSYEVIRALSQMEESALQQALAHLVDAELLYQQGLPPQVRYTFKHILIQEAAYQSLLRRTRRRYHREIAQVLEARFPETCKTQPELLAHHYTEAGLSAQAIVYWQRAAQEALERSAHLDAIAHVQQALAALALLPDSPEHCRYELTLQTMLGAALAFTRGYGAPEVVRAYDRARELCEQVDDMPQLFIVLRGLWLFYLARSELSVAYELGKHFLSLAQRRDDPVLSLEAHRAVATSLFFLGEQTAAVPHLERCLTFYGTQQHRTLRLQYGQDTGVMFLLYKAWNLWLRGYPDQALQAMDQMMCLTEQHPHFYSRSHALTLAVVLHQWRRETHIVRERVEASLALVDEHGSSFLQALDTTFQGWVLAQQGRQDEGIGQIRRGIAAYRATGTELFSTYMLALLAGAYQQAGTIEAGLHALAEALTLVTTHGERWWEAELHRRQGELLLQRTMPDLAQAETSLHQALAVARNQQAKSLELRATMSLCRLWQQQGKHRQAHDLLREIYGWFTEGHDTADLMEAKALLETFA